MDTWKGVGVRTSHGGVMGLLMRCTKMHQNAPKCTKMVSIALQSKVFWISPKWLMWSISGVNGHLEGCRSQSKSWRGYGVAHEVHQNAPKKWITLVTQDKFEILCSVMLWWQFWCILVHFGAPHVQPHNPSMTCSDSYTLPSVHLLQKWITLVTQD